MFFELILRNASHFANLLIKTRRLTPILPFRFVSPGSTPVPIFSHGWIWGAIGHPKSICIMLGRYITAIIIILKDFGSFLRKQFRIELQLGCRFGVGFDGGPCGIWGGGGVVYLGVFWFDDCATLKRSNGALELIIGPK